MSEKTGTARFVIAGVKSGSGKTLITCGLIAAFKELGLSVCSMKCGPDYIDPMFHRKVLGIPSGNLDSFFTDKEETRKLLAKSQAGYDLAIIEGVMGYYDGLGGESSIASTYEIAGYTDSPVILVVDGKGASVTLAALIQGVMNYKKNSNIQGVILNRVSKGYYDRIRCVIEETCGVKVLGYLPNKAEFGLASRHLGLVQPEEIAEFQSFLDSVREEIKRSIDLDGILAIANGAVSLSCPKEPTIPEEKKVRIAVARDEAFSFYYEENLKLLEQLGAELVMFSPMYDKALPENISGLLLGGGYPENYARELSENVGILEEIRLRVVEGLPCLAECGGFLYLQKNLEGMDGNRYPMAGVLSGEGFRTTKLCRFGYVLIPQLGLRGHEFHYYDCTENGADLVAVKPAVKKDENGAEAIDIDNPKDTYPCMVCEGNLVAGFPHLYYASNVDFAEKFVENCRKYGEKYGYL